MSISLFAMCRRALPLTAVSLLMGCQTAGVVVDQTEQEALSQCQATLSAQQAQFQHLNTRLDEQLALTQASLDIQRRLADAPPPAPVIIPRTVDCPKPEKPAVPKPSALDNVLQEKLLVGERENVLINALDIELRARINTGASQSLLDARNIQLFERNGEEWVRFSIADRKTEQSHEVERKRLRFVTGSGEDSRRPIVSLQVTIGKLTQNIEFVLNDRSEDVIPMVIGRNALRDVMVVDVSKSDLAKPVVPQGTANEKAKQ